MNANNFYLGGDASKGYCDFVIVGASKQTVESNFQLDDTPDGHKFLEKVLCKFFSRYPAAILHAGLESTGGYENNWYNMLLNLNLKKSLNLKVCRLNPVGVNHNKRANLTRNSTDKISAREIALYLIDHPKKIIYNRTDPNVALRKEWKFIRMLKKQSGQLKNNLEAALYTTNPHLLTFWKGDLPRWLLLLITHYPSAKKLARARVKAVSKLPYVTTSRAEELIKSAKISIGSEQDEIAELRTKALAQQILHLDKLIEEQTQFMIQHNQIPQIDLLTSFKGIGEFSAVGLMLIIGDPKRFEACDKMCAYMGVQPEYKESGDGTWAYRMSKKGSKEGRWILFNVAKSAIVHNDMIREIYEEYLAAGKEKMSAIGIIMHKITRIIYGMLKHNTKFDPEIDRNNRAKQRKKETGEVKEDKNRRYQQPDLNAPISKRQKKKRQRIAEQKKGRQEEHSREENIFKLPNGFT